MKSSLKLLLLFTSVFGSAAMAAPSGTTMSCHVPEPLAHGTVIRRFDIPQADDALVAPDFADLTGSGTAELVQPGQRGFPRDLATVSARTRSGADSWVTRATLAFPGERILAVKAIDGAVVGSDESRIVLVASTTATDGLRLRHVRGSSWQVDRECDFDGGGYFYAEFAKVSTDSELALYLLGNAAVSIYSVANGTLIRSIDLSGGNLFKVAQLDADDALEIVVEGTPGLILDAVSGNVDWSYAPGFGPQIATGDTAAGGHWLATTGPMSNVVTIYSTSPFATSWTIPLSSSNIGLRQMTAHDSNGDGTDELLVAGSFYVGPLQSIDELRIYDIATQAVLGAEPIKPYGVVRQLVALPGRSSNLPEVAVTYANQFPAYVVATFTHPFGLPDAGRQNWEESGPFSAVAEGDFNNDATHEIAYSGRGGSGPTRGGAIHVLASSDWSSVWTMPADSYTDYYRFPQTFDIASIASPYGPGRLLIAAGVSWYGSLAAIDGTTHAVRWILGNVNGQPEPMRFREAQRIAVGDTDGDGQEEILVAASTTAWMDPGTRLHLFDATGNELWRSQELPTQGNVNALKLLAFGNGRTPLALVSTSVSTLAFELPGEVPAWSIAGPALAIHPLPQGGYAVLHGDCSVERLDAARQTLWRSSRGTACAAIHQPVAGGPLLAAAGRHLRWLNIDTGAQIGVSAPLMPDFAFGNRWKAVPFDDDQKVQVTAGGKWGFMEVEIPVPPSDVIFMDAFN